MSSKKILRAVSVVSLGTVIARVFGLAREITTANFFGTISIYDAFLLAFMIPNFFRGLIAEGALNTAFIPVFTEYTLDEKRKEEGKDIFNICLTLSLIITSLIFIIVLGVSFVSTKIVSETSRWYYVWILLRFTFPYLIFISLAALNTGVLNAYKSFFIPSLSPVVLDLFWIAALFLILPFIPAVPERQIFVLCIGVLLGGLGQFLFTLIPVVRRGYKIHFNFNFSHPAVKKMGLLLAPMVIGVAVTPINLLVDNTLANTLYEGAVSGLWYSTRIFQLPLGVFAISISTAVLPWFSENISSQDHQSFVKNLIFATRMLVFLLLPFTFGMVILRTELVTFLFARGMFTAKSVALVSSPLAFYSLGLLGYGGASVWGRAFYACKDTVTPVKVGVFSIFMNFIMDIIFMQFMGHNGIALSTSIVGITNFILLVILFNRKHLYINLKKEAGFFLKIFFASSIMGYILYIYKNYAGFLLSLPYLVLSCIIISVLIYILTTGILIKVRRLKE
ncbi:MAG TPA: murein biosynthesis integral membrane protein MurJ [bacterium]|nr:murein biosynthesis integral membrane protein MurJ [bacterium]HPP30553.1 murein biosynthesis integral membrane protein MurJ [bacterium]